VDVRQVTAQGVVVLDVTGRVDNTTAPALQDQLITALGGPGARVLIDFTRLDYISSAGFRTLLLAAKRAQETGCSFVLCGLSARMRQIFDLVGFPELLSIVATREEGIAAAR
jgi:anti-anti-sigma factor